MRYFFKPAGTLRPRYAKELDGMRCVIKYCPQPGCALPGICIVDRKQKL